MRNQRVSRALGIDLLGALIPLVLFPAAAIFFLSMPSTHIFGQGASLWDVLIFSGGFFFPTFMSTRHFWHFSKNIRSVSVVDDGLLVSTLAGKRNNIGYSQIIGFSPAFILTRRFKTPCYVIRFNDNDRKEKKFYFILSNDKNAETEINYFKAKLEERSAGSVIQNAKYKIPELTIVGGS